MLSIPKPIHPIATPYLAQFTSTPSSRAARCLALISTHPPSPPTPAPGIQPCITTYGSESRSFKVHILTSWSSQLSLSNINADIDRIRVPRIFHFPQSVAFQPLKFHGVKAPPCRLSSPKPTAERHRRTSVSADPRVCPPAFV